MKPRIRFVEIQPYGDKFLLSDPVGITPPLLITKELLLILSLMDGNRELTDIQAEFFKRTGQILPREELNQIIQLLDENYLLLNERFFKKLEEERKKLLSLGKRPPSHTGQAYPDNPNALKKFIEDTLAYEGREDAVGIIVPHMDLRVAKETYGKVYSRLKHLNPDIVVILGVSHYYHETPFSVLPLDLDTPIGVLKTNKEIIQEIQKDFDYDLTHDILAYTQEHSIDFQTIFVKYLFPETQVLPAIVSYGDTEFLKRVAGSISRALERFQKPLIISSVDFSHVGRKFGDPAPYDPSPRDKEYIEHLCALKNDKAFKLLQKDNNRTRIDGQFTNYVFLEILKNLGVSEGRLVDYQIYDEPPTASKVSYAGMIFS